MRKCHRASDNTEGLKSALARLRRRTGPSLPNPSNTATAVGQHPSVQHVSLIVLFIYARATRKLLNKYKTFLCHRIAYLHARAFHIFFTIIFWNARALQYIRWINMHLAITHSSTKSFFYEITYSKFFCINLCME